MCEDASTRRKQPRMMIEGSKYMVVVKVYAFEDISTSGLGSSHLLNSV